MCINDTGELHWQSSEWHDLSFVDPAAQFRFRDNGAMLNLKTQGSLTFLSRDSNGYYLDMFYLHVSIHLDQHHSNKISQTCWGGLSTYYKGYTCAVPKTYKLLRENQGIDPYISFWQTATKPRINILILVSFSDWLICFYSILVVQTIVGHCNAVEQTLKYVIL